MAVIIFPAIDLYGGKTVRLSKGDYGRMSEYAIDPADAARNFLDAGCRHIHIVDLEGAKCGEPKHLAVLEKIAAMGFFVQYGGGLRSADAIASAISAGASRVMAGSLIFKDMEHAPGLAARFGKSIMAAVDIKDGKAAYSGWYEKSSLSAREAVEKLSEAGFSSFLVTLTEFDGTMRGTDADFYRPFVSKERFIAAAGGVTNESDIAALARAGVDAAVIGKSLYEGGITLKGALNAAESADKEVKTND